MLTPYQRQPHHAAASNEAALLQAFAPLRVLVEQWATEKFQQLLSSISAPVSETTDETMTRPGLRAEFGICDQTAINWEKRGIIKSYRLGRRVVYKRAEVLAAMEGQARPDGTRRNARRGQKQNPR